MRVGKGDWGEESKEGKKGKRRRTLPTKTLDDDLRGVLDSVLLILGDVVL